MILAMRKQNQGTSSWIKFKLAVKMCILFIDISILAFGDN